MELSQFGPLFCKMSLRAVIGSLLISLYINDITEDTDSAGGYRLFGVLGKELGHEIPASQKEQSSIMQRKSSTCILA